jgi:hypothetical protein
MNVTTLDSTLAFTALLEQDPSFRQLTPDAASLRMDALLAAWYAQSQYRNLWAFTTHWLDSRDTRLQRWEIKTRLGTVTATQGWTALTLEDAIRLVHDSYPTRTILYAKLLED